MSSIRIELIFDQQRNSNIYVQTKCSSLSDWLAHLKRQRRCSQDIPLPAPPPVPVASLKRVNRLSLQLVDCGCVASIHTGCLFFLSGFLHHQSLHSVDVRVFHHSSHPTSHRLSKVAFKMSDLSSFRTACLISFSASIFHNRRALVSNEYYTHINSNI